MSRAPSALKALREFTRTSLPDSEITALHAVMVTDSDRAIIITNGSWVENAVGSALLSRMRDLDSNEHDALFGTNGPLSSFSAKINIAYAHSLFGPKTKRDLHIVRELRNAAAHARRPLSFDTPEIIATIDLLSGVAMLKNADYVRSRDERRRAFITFSNALAMTVLHSVLEKWTTETRDRYLP